MQFGFWCDSDSATLLIVELHKYGRSTSTTIEFIELIVVSTIQKKEKLHVDIYYNNNNKQGLKKRHLQNKN